MIDLRWTWRLLVLFVGLGSVAGCGGPGVDDTYGRMHSRSINATGIFAGFFSVRGHEVRTAIRLTDELRDWADVIVRFADEPGPVPRAEATWYAEWLDELPGRRLIYVPHDYDATVDYWTLARDQLPKDASARLRERVDEALAKASKRVPLPFIAPPRAKKAKELAPATEWFAVKETSKEPKICKTLGGPWASGVDPAKAAITRHQTLKRNTEELLLSGDGEPLVMTWTRANDSAVLVVANGSFLLNLPLVNRARWPLASRTVSWAVHGDGSEDERSEPKRVAFVEGMFLHSGNMPPPSVFELARRPPFDWPVAQLLILGLAACLARAPRLGRARPEEPTGADRPVAHPEALGVLLARTGRAPEARSLLEAYQRWRGGPSARG